MSQSNDFVNEEWRSVVGYEGWYEVSDLGRVKRVKGGSGAVVGGILRTNVQPNGYIHLALYKDTKAKNVYMHHLVGNAFLGACPEGMERNHKDGNKANNIPSNIEYVSHANNMEHAKKLGLYPRGSKKPEAKLNECLARFIKLNLRYESSYRLSKILKMPCSTVDNIKLGTNWAHVTLDG